MKKTIRSTQILFTPGTIEELRDALGVESTATDPDTFTETDENDGEVVQITGALEAPWPITVVDQAIIHGDNSQLSVAVTLDFDYPDDLITNFEVRVTAQ